MQERWKSVEEKYQKSMTFEVACIAQGENVVLWFICMWFYQRTKMSQNCADTFAGSTHIPLLLSVIIIVVSIQLTRELFSNRKSFSHHELSISNEFRLKCFLTFQLTRQYFPSFSQNDIPNIPFDIRALSKANWVIKFRFHRGRSKTLKIEINQYYDEIERESAKSLYSSSLGDFFQSLELTEESSFLDFFIFCFGQVILTKCQSIMSRLKKKAIIIAKKFKMLQFNNL